MLRSKKTSANTSDWPAAVGAFVERARERLDKAPPERLFDPFMRFPRGDHELSPEIAEFMTSVPPRHAAVLVPIIGHAEPTVLLTQRSSELPEHAGQVAFPGGKIDPADPDPLATALREAEEEIGLAAHHATPLGYLDAYLSAPASHRAGRGGDRARLRALAQSVRGRGRVRSAACLSHVARQPRPPFARMARQATQLLCDALRRALHLGRDRGYPPQSL
jgi:8-oxo-dGTP pyrophosphatase MutT (NUDIX family)